MPNIQQTYRHQHLPNSLTPEQLHIIDEELARIRETRRIALEQGGNPQNVSAGSGGTRAPTVQAGDPQNTGTGTDGQQDPTPGLGDLKDTSTGTTDTQNPISEPATEEIIDNRPTTTTTTTAGFTLNSTSTTSTGPTTITTMIDLTEPVPTTTTTITTTGVTTISTNTTPFLTIDSDTEEEDTTKPNSKHQKTDRSEDTGKNPE
jgi:hypothetical protein